MLDDGSNDGDDGITKKQPEEVKVCNWLAG